MRWAWSIGKIAGIEIKLHATLLILLAWVAWTRVVAGAGVPGVLDGLFFVALLFSIVVLHELGHALVARRYEIATRSITLLPIGGVAALERLPDDPRAELKVALAGPAVNAGLAIVLGLALAVTGTSPWIGHAIAPGPALIAQLFWINVGLAAFNLVPAFPMDGGRALRAVLAMRMGNVRATQVAATIGQGIALVFGVAGLFYDPVLLFIALFVWLGASSEAKLVQLEDALEGIPIGYAMMRRVATLPTRAVLQDALEHAHHEGQHDFPVVEHGRVVGVLARHEILAALLERGPLVPIATLTRRDVPLLPDTAMLDDAFEAMQRHHVRSLPVVRADGSLAGLVTMHAIGELLLVHSTLREPRRRDDHGRGLTQAWAAYVDDPHGRFVAGV